MKPYVWVIVDPDGVPRALLPDDERICLGDAWLTLADEIGFSNQVARLADEGFTVQRCRLFEVGPA